MAQHYKMISFVNEPWFSDVVNEIKEALKKPEYHRSMFCVFTY